MLQEVERESEHTLVAKLREALAPAASGTTYVLIVAVRPRTTPAPWTFEVWSEPGKLAGGQLLTTNDGVGQTIAPVQHLDASVFAARAPPDVDVDLVLEVTQRSGIKATE